jgi:hypothetical protein
MRLMRSLHGDASGSALVTALLASAVMLILGMSLLAIVDSQASQSVDERKRDRSFNLSESVLNSEAFVLGRTWPDVAPAGNPVCSAAGAGFTDTIGSNAATSNAVQRLRPNLNASYRGVEYGGATWQVNLCDDVAGATVWSNAVLNNAAWDANGNNFVWVRAESVVGGNRRVLVGLVGVREAKVLDSKYALVAGRVTDDLGASINNLSSNALGGVLSGLLGSTPTVAADPTKTATNPPSSGVTGLRCGALNVSIVPPVTCLAGTLGATGALPIVGGLITGGKLEQFPRTTAMTSENIDRLRAKAIASHTYYAASAGASTTAAAPACTFSGNTGTPSKSTIVFLEQVGTGDDYCVIDVSAGRQYKTLVIGSGRVVIRGNGTSTGTPVFTAADLPQVNTFSGVVYALNQQRLPVADGGKGLGDATTPGREIVSIENGAHVKGAVFADGKSGRVTILPPAVTLNTNTLVDALIPCVVVLGLPVCTLRNTIKALGATALIDALITNVGLTSVVNGVLAQVQPQRAQYGSAIVSDVNAVDAITVYGTSAVVSGSFSDVPVG